MICPPTWGHGVNVFAYVDGQKIFVEGYFSGKSKAVDSVVEVFDAQGNKLHEGKTNNNGVYSFKVLDVVPVRGDLRIVLKAGPEHQAEFRLPAVGPTGLPEAQGRCGGDSKEPQSQDMNLSESRSAEASYDQAAAKKTCGRGCGQQDSTVGHNAGTAAEAAHGIEGKTALPD